MSKILKNNTSSIVDINDVGVSVPASSQITINTADFDDFAASNDIVALIGDGTLTVSDGSFDLELSDGIKLIQGLFPNTIAIPGDPGAAGANGFGVYAFANVTSSGVVNKGRGITVTRSAIGTYQYTLTTPAPDTNYIVSAGFENIGTNTDTNWFVNNKTINGFTLTTGIGDNGTAVDTLSDFNHSVTILGDAGPQGISSAYDAWLSIGNTGTEADFIASLVGATGATGPQGPQGPPGDSQIRVSPNDSTVGFIEDKFTAGSNKISISVLNDGADEDLTFDVVPANIGTSELNNDANFIDSAGAPVQPGDIANFETSTQLDTRDTNNRSRANHTGTQLASTISDLGSAITAGETTTSLSFNAGTNILSFTDEDGGVTNIDLSLYLDDTNLSRITGGVLNSITGICTFTRDDLTTFDVDFSSLNDQAFINAAIAAHETSITNHDDVDTSGVIAGDKLIYDGSNWIPFKDFKAFAKRTDVIIADQQFVPSIYLTLNVTVPETGNYEIITNYLYSIDSTGTDILARVLLDTSTELFFHRQEAKDSAGTGYAGTNVNGNPDNTGTDQRYPATYHDVINLTAGSHTIELEWQAQGVDIETSILQASILLKRFN